MERVITLKQSICALFEVHDDANGVRRVVTPLEYPGSGDKIVIRIRPHEQGFLIDENGEAALYATMAGGDVDSEGVARWAEELNHYSPADYSPVDEKITLITQDERLLAPYIFRVAEAAQQLFSIATSRVERQTSDFKDRVKTVIMRAAQTLNMPYEADYVLPLAGGLTADHYIDGDVPLIVVAANSVTRLLEAEIIHMQYKFSRRAGFILAVAESQKAVGVKQFERANFYTGKTVSFIAHDLEQMIINHQSQFVNQ